MDALFVAVNAKYIHTNNAVRLLHLNSQFKTDFLEFTIKDDSKTILDTITELNPKVIGFSVYIWNVDKIVKLVKSLKAISDVSIILGGPEVSYDAVHFLDETHVDMIVKGEGEAVIDNALDYLINGVPINNLSNVAYYQDDALINAPIKEIDNLASIVHPYKVEKDRPHLPQRIAYIEASRGCPYKCSYCLSSLEKKVRFFPLETIIENIDYLLDNNVKTFKFLDRTFNANKTMFTIIDHIINHHKNDTVFQFEITGDILDPKIIDYIHAHAPKGLFRFEIGIQSTNYQTNQSVDRHQDNTKLFNNIQTIKDKGIITMHLDLIAGLPYEDLASFKNTFNTVFNLGAEELQLGFLKLLRGTKIRREASKYCIAFDDNPPYEITSTHVLSQDDITTIKHVETTLNVFHNKGHFDNFIEQIVNTYYKPFDFFEKLFTKAKRNHVDLLHYQLYDLYVLLDDFLQTEPHVPAHLRDSLKTLYLKHFNVKPKLYFDKVMDRTIKRNLFNYLIKDTPFPIDDFYKHSITIDLLDTYFIVLYKNNKNYSFTVKKDKIS